MDKGGFIITIAEMCFKSKLGATINLSTYNTQNLRDDELLFSESVGRFIIETDPVDNDEILKLAERFGVFVKKIGSLTNVPEMSISGMKSEQIKLDLNKLKRLYDSTIPKMMDI